ncbi:MAG: hypothetical protein AB7O28_15545 [Vicinamibacterales bacterium]
MRSAAFTVAALLAGLGGLTPLGARQKDEYPHAFPRAGVTQILDNTRVTVWEVNWLHGTPQPIHRHKYDMAGVYLRWGPITVTGLDGKAVESGEFPVPRPYFQVKGITHREEAHGKPGDPERLAIMVDLKDAVTDMMVIDADEPPAWPRDGARNVLENPRIRMWDYTFAAGAPAQARAYRNDVVEVVVTGGTVQVSGPGMAAERRELAPKQARYIRRGTVQTEQGVSGSPRIIAIELK